MAGEAASIVVWPPNHKELAAAFRSWTGSDADLRVLFTPDVLIGFDSLDRRGYLYDDGQTVEVWVERGLTSFLDLLSGDYVASHCEIRHTDDGSCARLLELALRKGEPLDEVRHLL